MNKTILALLTLVVIFIMGCQPTAMPAAEPAAEPAPAEPAAPAPAAEPAAPEAEAAADEEVTPAPLENIPLPPAEYVSIDKVCYDLIDETTFNEICEREGQVVFTHKISERSCWVNIADHFNSRLTAGFTVRDWEKAEEANREFDRGVNMRRTQGAEESQEVGERSYQYQEIGRNNLAWVRGTFLADMGIMTDLCPADKHAALARKITENLG